MFGGFDLFNDFLNTSNNFEQSQKADNLISDIIGDQEIYNPSTGTNMNGLCPRVILDEDVIGYPNQYL